jgi:hypothetical protein
MKAHSPPHPALDLPPNLYRQLVYTLTDLLPPPLDDSPEALYARNHAAIAKVAALLPVDANEVDLAAQCIAARAQAEDLLRLLRQHAGDIALVMRLNAQYGSMVRTSLSVHARLMRVQAQRHKREAIDGAASADARARDIAELSMLKVALQDAGPRQPTSPEQARPKSPEPARAASPKVAPVETRPTSLTGAPADCVTQMIDEPISENGTNSQDVAFETWLSEQPWNRGGSGETVLNDLVREAMAKSRLADQELTANSRESPKLVLRLA